MPDLTLPDPTIGNVAIAVAALVVAAGCLYLLYRLLRATGRAAIAGARTLGQHARRFSLIHLRRSSVLIVGAAGMLAAAFGTVRALDGMGQPLPLALATSAAIEGGAIYLAADLYIRTREGRPALRPRLASWGYALASAWANATHPPSDTSWTGALIFGLVPLLGLYLIEYQAHADRARTTREVTAWPLRVTAAAWRRAWTAVATALGIDVNASDTDTERELAARKAARATYRLRLAQQVHSAKASHRSGRRLRRCTRAAQAARERAGVASDPEQALRLAILMRELVHGPEHAAGDWSNVTASASRVYGGMLLAGPGGLYDLTGRSGEVPPPAPTTGPPVRLGPPVHRSARELEADRGPVRSPGPTNSAGSDERTTPVLEDLSPAVRTAIEELGADLSKRTLIKAVRSAGESISSDRAVEVVREVKRERTGIHVVRGEVDREDRTG